MPTLRHTKLVPLATLFFLGGCAETAEVPPALADARSELTNTEAAFYVITRREALVVFAARAGQAMTKCPDDVERPDCALSTIDLSRADLSVEDERAAQDRLDEGRAMVRAKLVSGGLVVSEVWTRTAASSAQADARVSTDAMFRLVDVREGGDAWLRAEPLGGARATHHTRLDLGQVGGGLDAAERAALTRGNLFACGAPIGTTFVVGAVYAPFPAPRVAEAPSSAPDDVGLRGAQRSAK